MRNVITSFLLLTTLIALGQNQTIESLYKLSHSGNYHLVIEKATALLDADPGNVGLNLLIGRVYAEHGHWTKAVPYLDFTITHDSTWRKAWALGYLGTFYFISQEYDRSRKAYGACIALNATETATRAAQNKTALFGYDGFYDTWKIVESNHFRFHFQKMSDTDMDRFISLREKAYEKINYFFQSALPKKIDFFVWESKEDRKKILGTDVGFARPEFCLVHCDHQQTPGHEMTHVISHYSTNVVTKTPLINEGTAVCFDLSKDKGEEIVRNWIKAKHKTVRIKDIWSNWKDCPGPIRYPLSGLFVTKLIDQFGKDKFLEFFRDQTYENAQSVFGDKLDVMIQELENRINNLQTLH